jgi:hypothetical protein
MTEVENGSPLSMNLLRAMLTVWHIPVSSQRIASRGGAAGSPAANIGVNTTAATTRITMLFAGTS